MISTTYFVINDKNLLDLSTNIADQVDVVEAKYFLCRFKNSCR